MKVLCVDDADIHLTSIKSMLKLVSLNGQSVAEIFEAKNGKLAVEQFKSMITAKPDLITLDIRMPELDGLSALVLIKSLAPRTPVVMVSSEDEKTISRKKGGAAQIPMNEKFALIDKVAARVKAGVVEPGAAVLRKKRVLPSPLPIKRSRSPSPSISAKAGLEVRPTSAIPKGLVAAVA